MSNKFAIEVKNLSVRFGSFEALKNVEFAAEFGEFVSVIGPNGAGKSTLLKTVLGAIKPTSGEVLTLGGDPRKLDPRHIGYVPQLKTIDRSFPAKAIELVAAGIDNSWPGKLKGEVYEKAIDALDKVGAAEFADKQIKFLSGGELQRIFLAKSFAGEPKILVMDEPASGVDIGGEIDFYAIVGKFRKRTKATVLMVTHDWETAYHHSDKALMLLRNQICYERPDKAFSEENLRRAFGHIGHEHEMIFAAGSKGGRFDG